MFQYPLRVEMDWNQARHLSLDTEPHRFSTLCGSKWIGTCRRSDHLLPFQQVSVPSAGRNGLELNRFATSLCNLSGFQYPLRVEMDWNAAPNSHRDSHLRSFSTLCGSKWIGTIKQRARNAACHKGFSTLCGSKWIGTPCGNRGRVSSNCVSVPSAGRNGLERNWKMKSPPLTCVSVPSAGRNGLERLRVGIRGLHWSSFSTLCGSKWIGTTQS